MRKPRLFIASSVESLDVAEAVNVNLDHDLEVTIWKNGTFRLSSSTIDDLVKKSSTVDFALFIFTPDDIATIRDAQEHVVRDNVLFELGLFIGAIGKERSFILKPRNVEMHLPTDLLGITAADYEANRSDGDLTSATNRACSLVKSEVSRIGLINHAALSETKSLNANPANYQLTELDLGFLASCLRTRTEWPERLSYHQIENDLKHMNSQLLPISAIKLERMGLIDKCVCTDNQSGDDYFGYEITELGVDIVLKNQDQLPKKIEAKTNSYDEASFL
ncbi:TIR domain-containing protein [Spartinivicinus ruber]|uniref:TIR domain-containing protein n=1 Tax=Spartinivicinus ruber TaxID=2683272 RepID=UPI0013D38D24|nr:nucleotide-binding protein [Spartinivicinus ruber]